VLNTGRMFCSMLCLLLVGSHLVACSSVRNPSSIPPKTTEGIPYRTTTRPDFVLKQDNIGTLLLGDTLAGGWVYQSHKPPKLEVEKEEIGESGSKIYYTTRTSVRKYYSGPGGSWAIIKSTVVDSRSFAQMDLEKKLESLRQNSKTGSASLVILEKDCVGGVYRSKDGGSVSSVLRVVNVVGEITICRAHLEPQETLDLAIAWTRLLADRYKAAMPEVKL